MLNQYDYLKFCESEKKQITPKISILNYLMNDYEETPMWLMNYKKGKKLNYKQILNSKILYFPSCINIVGQPLKMFNKAQLVHTFVYASSTISKEKAYCKLINNPIKGYKLYDLIELEKGDSNPKILKTNNYETLFDVESYGYLAIYERDSEYNEAHGGTRIAIIMLGGDPIEIYNSLFVKNNVKPYILVLLDVGFTNNYSCFGQAGALNELAAKSNALPKYLYCAKNTMLWDGYEKIECVMPEYAGHTYFYLCEKIKRSK